MPNQEHLEILKQGVVAWNKWRIQVDSIKPDLTHANLEGVPLLGAELKEADLSGVNLSSANLFMANLSGADLFRANLFRADLSESNLSKVNLSEANLSETNLRRADLSEANLSHSRLTIADLEGANLSRANLSKASFIGAYFIDTDLKGADLSGAVNGMNAFGNNDLSEVKGLDSMVHQFPSTVGINTLYKSAGKIPEDFLRGCGLNDWEIEAVKLYRFDLNNEVIGNILYKIHHLRACQPIQISPIFISYNHE